MKRFVPVRLHRTSPRALSVLSDTIFKYDVGLARSHGLLWRSRQAPLYRVRPFELSLGDWVGWTKWMMLIGMVGWWNLGRTTAVNWQGGIGWVLTAMSRPWVVGLQGFVHSKID